MLYVGTDHGAFWVSKDDGAYWEEHSTGIGNNYIRSIAASRFNRSRVYLSMTGINYDDLHCYLYTSEDDGKNWKNISTGLPDEPVNVILEDPSNENILYAGGLRGVYISVDRGNNWSYLGINMPATAVADMEIQVNTKDLVVATHGRGIYKTNLRPIQSLFNQKKKTDNDYLFEINKITRPWFNSSAGEVDYRTLEKAEFTFWLKQPRVVTLAIRDNSNKEIWKSTINGHQGFNQFRWDLIIKKETSDYPYFVHYDKFIEAGSYNLVLTAGENLIKQTLEVIDSTSPYEP